MWWIPLRLCQYLSIHIDRCVIKFQTFIVILYDLQITILLFLCDRDREAAIGEALVPGGFIEFVIAHLRAFAEPVHHFVHEPALGGEAGIASVLPPQLIFRRA